MGKFINAVWLTLAIVLASFSGNVGKVLSNFRLLDPWGYETSFPYVGGVVRILCKGQLQDNTTETYLVNKTDPEILNRKIENDTFVLEHGLVGTQYNCLEGAQSDLAIGPLHCNPFSMIPIVANCSDDQWCMIAKDGNAKCENKNPAMCFWFPVNLEASEEKLPSTAYHPYFIGVCSENSDGSVTTYETGLCSTYGKRHILGLTNKIDACFLLHDYGFKFNGNSINQNSVNFVPVTNAEWKITMDRMLEADMGCSLFDEHKQSLTNFTFSANKSVKPEFKKTLLPAKVKLTCTDGRGVSFTIFAIVYDPNLTNYEAVVNKTPINDLLVLTCACQVPKGFLCGSKWDHPRKIESVIVQNDEQTYKTMLQQDYILPTKPKPLTLKPWEHPSPVNYTCYMQVFAYDYPNSFHLKLVPLEKNVIETTITITSEDFVTTNPEKAMNGTIGELNEGKAKDQSNSQDKSKVTALIALISICLIIVIILVVAGIFGYIKVGTISKKLNETEAKLNLSKAVTRESNRKKTSSFSTDQDNNKRVSLLDEKKKSIPPKLPSRKIDNVESKYGGLKARRN